MKTLVIGSGGREHAILWALRKTAREPIDLYCAPGNGGISELAECVPVPVSETKLLARYARENATDLTIVGPEGPLADGIVDEFESAGLRIVGPSCAASRLESSKGFAKDFMQRHRIPTAQYQLASSQADALSALGTGRFGAKDSPVVVKADGLAAGKGVIVASSHLEAERAIDELLSGSLVDRKATSQLIIEETLQGTEVSVLAFASGRDYVVMPPARDHKRIGEHDTGPNTGGMGAITDSSVLDPATLKRIQLEIIEPTLQGATDEGFPFRGILFVGLMLTSDGPKVLEYNVRFGDPETQAILVRLSTDLYQIFDAIVSGNLRDVAVDWSDQSSACVVLASGGYPGSCETGLQISGLPMVSNDNRLQIFHAGTRRSEDGKFLTAGGRVLGVTAADDTLSAALNRCYAAIDTINWNGMQYRKDIGKFHDRAEVGG